MALTPEEIAGSIHGDVTVPKFGNRLLPSVLDQWANGNRARLYAVAPHAYAVNITTPGGSPALLDQVMILNVRPI